MRERQAISVVVPDSRFSGILSDIGRLKAIEANGMLGISIRAKFCQSKGSRTYDTVVFSLKSGLCGDVAIEACLRDLPEQFAQTERLIRDLTNAVESVFNVAGVESMRVAARAINDFVDSDYAVTHAEASDSR